MSFQQIIRKYPLSFASLISAVMLVIGIHLLGLELWEELVELIAKGEDFELDEFIIPLGLIFLGIVGDAFLLHQQRESEQEKLDVYNHMNQEMMDEISTHLTKLLEFRTAMMNEGANSQDVRHELDRIIVRSFHHFEQAQRRSDIDSSAMPLVVPGMKPSRVTVSSAHSDNSEPPATQAPISKPPAP